MRSGRVVLLFFFLFLLFLCFVVGFCLFPFLRCFFCFLFNLALRLAF